ncbi:E3 ubiquitin-protein ligase NEURL1B [Larimichthys crocea]|uniref:RING-type E3 ubiquitin transferase n=1 Tax=Larimichthys crocea TaxID=215358 RepID=A0A6G0I3K0_LARCR|nr:E3 ubiquitin-protein ligase NEURL1B [Larimichthys crocea]
MGNTTPKPLIDSTLQPRPVANRQYYTLPNNGAGVERRTSAPPVSVNVESPRFHPHAKGKNIRLDGQLRRATRKNSFCNGITFSHRPVHLYEKVRLRLTGVHTGWSGALRFGFTSLDPSELVATDIPKYACPDLVTRPGYWAKALPERLALKDNVLSFWADRHGRVFYSINEGEPILFHCGLSIGCPLWAIIDIYGITQEVTLLESTFAESVGSSCLSAARLSAYLPQSSHDSANYSNNQLENNQAAAAKMANLQLNNYTQLIPCCSSTSSSTPSSSASTGFTVPRVVRGLPSPLDNDLHFHPIRGSDVILSADRSAACIHFLDSSRTLVIHLHAGDLPADPEVLLDRKEYWVVHRGFPMPCSGDILSFTLLPSGEVLWAFFTLHGAVNRLRILGTLQSSPPSTSPSTSQSSSPDDSDSDLAFSVNRSSSASESSLVTAPSSPLSPPVSPTLTASELPPAGKNGECTVCFDQEVDTVIYTCGHMCLCNDCGLKLKRQINACCPICRRPIKDVIKTYRP